MKNPKIGDTVIWPSGKAWRSGRNKPVSVPLMGTVIDKEDDGTLVVEDSKGKIVSVKVEDVTYNEHTMSKKKNTKEFITSPRVKSMVSILHHVGSLLEKMTDKEYQKILNRSNKKE